MTGLRIGTLAQRSGISVRMLRHYDEIGLLRPAQRSDRGYRLYKEADLERLQNIVALRQLGFGLREIAGLLDDPALPTAEVIGWRLARLEEEIAGRERLRATLRRALARISATGHATLDELLATIQEMTVMDRINAYYTEEQLAELARKREALGEDGMQRAEAAWAALIAEVKALMADQVPPTDARAKAAADQWMRLVEAFTGGDPGMTRSLQQVWDNEDEIAGINTREMRDLADYIQKARSAG